MSSKADVENKQSTVVSYAHDGQAKMLVVRNDTTSEDSTIESDRIIGIVSQATNSASGSSSTLLYVEISKASEESKPEESTTFQCIQIDSPPTDLTRDFAPGADTQLPQYLTPSDDPGALHIVLSIGSGQRLAQTYHDNLLHPFLTHLGLTEGKDYTLHKTTSSDTITELTNSTFLPRAATHPIDIVLVSGDGGILDVVNAVLNSSNASSIHPPTITILPLGTGNALAHSSGATADLTLGLSTFLRGTPHPLPLLTTTISSPSAKTQTLYGAIVTSWCLHASLVADSDTPEYRKHGAKRFQLAAQALLYPGDPPGSLPPHAYRAGVDILPVSTSTSTSASASQWRSLGTSHGYLLATQCSHLEAAFRISPSSTPLDGRLFVVRVPPLASGDAMMRVMGGAYDGGRHVDEEDVTYEEVAALRISFAGEEEEGRWRRVCVDGRIVEVDSTEVVVVAKYEGERGVCLRAVR